MPQCAKCGKKVKYKIISYGIWEYRDPFPEFYHKPLCDICYNQLDRERIESVKADPVEALCEHLRRMGLNATVKSKVYPLQRGILGSVRIANRNIDFVEMVWGFMSLGEDIESVDVYWCNFVVQAKVESLEEKLKAKGKPVRKSFFFSVVNFKWKGKELAQLLNSDAKLRSQLLSLHRSSKLEPSKMEIVPSKEDQCVRISPSFSRFSYFSDQHSAFPTPEAFEAFDRIAQHIRSIATVRP